MRDFPRIVLSSPALVFAFVAMALGSSPQAGESMDYEPLGEHSEWIMNASFVSSKGQVVSTVIHRKVEDKEVKDGQTYFRMHHWNEDESPKIDFIDLIRRDETGVYWIHADDNGGKEQLLRMLPIRLGQTWEIRRKEQPLQVAVAGEETVTIDGKVYEHCFHIRCTSPKQDMVEDDWEAPNVGTVKSEVIFPNGTRLILTLKEFKPGK